jgi:3-dehydroquinate dehydratase-2
MKSVIIINGPNLNLLGSRQKEIYGFKNFEEIIADLDAFAGENGIKISYFQSNTEGEIIDKIHESIGKTDYIVLNPGALTHYSYSLQDAITSAKIPVIEVHISNIYAREEWRRKSVISPVAYGIICGFGIGVYKLALQYIAGSQ